MNDHQLRNILEILATSHQIVVFTGAGISTNAGILDFRSPEGLYRVLDQRYDLPYPEAVFDIRYFAEHPEPFFDLLREMLSEDVTPTRCHEFLAWLEDCGHVAQIVTQNSDMLHQKAGSRQVVECHGTYRKAHCVSCERVASLDEITPSILLGGIPRCECGGVMKPDVVFFGEALPDVVYDLCESPPEADLVMVLGSSLTVQPVAGLVVEMVEDIPSILVNFEPTAYDDEMTHVVHNDLDVFAEVVWSALEERVIPHVLTRGES